MQTQPKYAQKGNLEYAVSVFPNKGVVKASVMRCPTIQDLSQKYCRKSVQPMMIYLCETEDEIEDLCPGIEGKARCLKEDTFDVVKGEKIAICKAELKYYQKMNRIYKRFIQKLLLTVKELEQLIERNDKKIANSQKALTCLTQES